MPETLKLHHLCRTTTISVTGSGPLGDIDLDGDSDLDDFRLLADECFQGPSMGILVEPAPLPAC